MRFHGKINLFDISVRVLTIWSCIFSCYNQRILFFLISHRYKLSICSVHAMSILFMLAQATAYHLFKLDDDSIMTFGDKRKPSNLLSLFLCFANLWLQSYIIIVFFIIVNIIIIIIIVVNNSLPKVPLVRFCIYFSWNLDRTYHLSLKLFCAFSLPWIQCE